MNELRVMRALMVLMVPLSLLGLYFGGERLWALFHHEAEEEYVRAVPVLLEETPADRVSIRHVVAPGESLRDIAMLYTVTVEELLRANGMSSEAVMPGQRLIIPPVR